MKKLSLLQVALNVLIVAAMAYVLWWSLTGLVNKLEGPAFANQTDASHWVAVHPAFVSFSRWFIPVVTALGLGMLVMALLQTQRPRGYSSRMTGWLIGAGCVMAVCAFIVLMAVKPNQWLLSSGQGTMMLDMAHSMWADTYSVLLFLVIILGGLTAVAGIWHATLAGREDAPAPVRTGWKSARNTARHHR